jgi:hypothetical protein
MSAQPLPVPTTYSQPLTTVADMARVQAWAARYLSRAADLPLTFTLGDQTVRGLPEAWRPTAYRRLTRP